MKLMKAIVLFSFLQVSVIIASACDQHPMISDSGKVDLASKVSWFKFKAKGAELNIIVNLDSNSYYEIYPHSKCDTAKIVMPVRSTQKGVSLLTEELWEHATNTGECFCSACLHRIKLDWNQSLELEQESFYLLKVVSSNPVLDFKLRWSSMDPSKKRFDLKQSIDALETGMLYQLKEVRFMPSSVRYIRNQVPYELDSLYLFLKERPSIKVEIIGHVNGPDNSDPAGYQKLSEARAGRIKKFLLDKGLDPSRVKSLGKGNTQMRYPSPKEEWQAIENRRVEVRITAL